MPKSKTARDESEALDVMDYEINQLIYRRARDGEQQRAEAEWIRTARAEQERLRQRLLEENQMPRIVPAERLLAASSSVDRRIRQGEKY